MVQVRRLYVGKQEGFHAEADKICGELRNFVGLSGLTSVRLITRYDIEGLSDADWLRVRDRVLTDPAQDIAWEETLPATQGEHRFAVEFLPGQYDMRADWASENIELLLSAKVLVRCARVYELSGDLSQADIEQAKGYLINAVEAREVGEDKPSTLQTHAPTPPAVETAIGFTTMDGSALSALRQSMGMAMTDADLACVQRYFASDERRDPTVTELRMLDTYWSDHCRHTTFLTTLDSVTFEEEGLATVIESSFRAYLADRETLGRKTPPNLMDVALTGPRLLKANGKLVGVDESEEINACSIVVTIEVDGAPQEWLVMFKNETHNHPTEVEPFGGAATCLGGAIRDPLSGRAYVYQAMRITGAGDPTTPFANTLESKLPQRKITSTAAAGYASYGNQIGLPGGQVREIYHPGYVAKRMELGAVVGAAKRENVIREVPVAGDVVILLGGRTGRDGIGGATGSSKEQDQDSLLSMGAEVQKGNPTIERNIERMMIRPEISRMIRRCNDFGAGGVSVAIGELAPGLAIDLDVVPCKYEGMDGTEIAISESQERMALVVAASDAPRMIEEAQRENLEATVVATVTAEPRLVMTWRGQRIVDISRAFLDTNGAEQHAKAHITSPDPAQHPYNRPHNEGMAWKSTLASLNVASQQGLVERFDNTAGAGTVLSPLAGTYQKTPVDAMAAKLPVTTGKTHAATIMTYGYDPFLSTWSPYHGAMMAVVDSLTKLVATGGDHEAAYLTFQEFFERLRDEPVRWGKPLAALLGALEAQKHMGVASIGGKDSMSGSFLDIDVPPTLVSFAISMGDDRHIHSGEFKEAGNTIFYLPTRLDENHVPHWDYQKKLLTAVRDGLRDGEIVSAHTVGIGGLAAALTQMCFGNMLGADLDNLPTSNLFDPSYGSLVIEAKNACCGEWMNGLDAFELGTVTKEPVLHALSVAMPLEELLAVWEAPLADVFPITAPCESTKDVPTVHATPCPTITRTKPVAQPRVFVPSLPGTNGEMEMARAFERAGAVANIGRLRSLSAADLAASVAEIAEGIKNAQILALPDGYAAPGEPGSSSLYLSTLLCDPRVVDAIMELLTQRDGLVLGIGTGAAALLRHGLLPYGEFRAAGEGRLTLAINGIGRHVCRHATVRVASKLSPWVSQCDIGEALHLPLSTSMGRFTASQEVLQVLAKSGQITTQFADTQGHVTMDPTHNLTGSAYAIEGLTSPDGRVLGKLCGSERTGEGVGVNLYGHKDDRLFLSGVRYYS